MARRSESGRTQRRAPDAASSGSRIDREAKTPGIALPADLGRSLRLLDDAQLDRSADAVTDEIRRRRRRAPHNPSVAGQSSKRTPVKAARAKPDGPPR